MQLALFIFLSPVWIAGMLLMVVGWRRRLSGRAALALDHDRVVVAAPVDDAGRSVRRRARLSVVAGWTMLVLSILPLGLFLLLFPRPSIPVFTAVVAWRWRVAKRPEPEPEPSEVRAPAPPLAHEPSPQRPALSGTRIAAAYAFPVFATAAVSSGWSTIESAFVWHGVFALYLAAVPAIFENSRPHRGGVRAMGEVIGHERGTDSDGNVRYQELVRFSTGAQSIEFEGLSSRRQRPIGAPVDVSYRFGEPDHPRAIPEGQGRSGVVLFGGVVAVAALVIGWTTLPIIGIVGLGYGHFVWLDRRRASLSDVRAPAPSCVPQVG